MPLLESTVAGILAYAAVETAFTGWERGREFWRERQFPEELEPIAAEFNDALADRLRDGADGIDSENLDVIARDWKDIAEDVDAYEVVLKNEEEAVSWLVNRVASLEDVDLSENEKKEFRTVLSDELATALDDFRTKIEGTNLEHQFYHELGIEVLNRLDVMAQGFDSLVDVQAQEERNDGFRKISAQYLQDHSSAPERCWLTGFTLADVYDEIPAERDGRDKFPASKELFEIILDGENRMIIGRPGTGKSTLCKQVAIRWYNHPDTGDVFYRESGGTKAYGIFESTDSLKNSIRYAQTPVLVAVEDAVRPATEAIFQLIEELGNIEDLVFLLDSREEELNQFDDERVPGTGPDARIISRAKSMDKYSLGTVSIDDVDRVVEAYQDATGRPVQRTPESLHEEITSTHTSEGIGELFILSFLLSFGDDSPPISHKDNEGSGNDNTILERHISRRYETLMDPGGESAKRVLDFDTKSRRKLATFDGDLLADVGVMVNLLTASGIGIDQELVLSLAHEYDIDNIHNKIGEIIRLLDGWFLYQRDDTLQTVHELWSTLYLRKLAQGHAEEQDESIFKEESEPRFGRCLNALFALCDDDKFRGELLQKLSNSSILELIDESPGDKATEYLEATFELGKRWPVLAPLFGTAQTAQYKLPKACDEGARVSAITNRAIAQRLNGALSKAESEHQACLELAIERDDQKAVAFSMTGLGQIAHRRSEYEEARCYHQCSLRISDNCDDWRGTATSLDDLGEAAQGLSQYKKARKHHLKSLEISKEHNDREGKARSLGSLGNVALSQSKYKEARDYFQRSLSLYEKLDDRQKRADNLGNLGIIAQRRSEYDDAYNYYRQCLNIFKNIGDHNGMGKMNNNLGIVAFRKGNYPEAKKYYQRSISVHENIGDKKAAAQSRDNLGIIFQFEGNYDKALEQHRRCLETFRDIGDKQSEARTLNNIGTVLLEKDNPNDAQDCFSQSLEISKVQEDRQGVATSLGGLGLVSQRREEYDSARGYYQQSIDIYEELEMQKNKGENLIRLGEVAQELEEFEAAGDYYQSSRDIFEQIGATRSNLEARRGQICLAIERGCYERAKKLCDDAIHLIESADIDLPDERKRIEELREDAEKAKAEENGETKGNAG